MHIVHEIENQVVEQFDGIEQGLTNQDIINTAIFTALHIVRDDVHELLHEAADSVSEVTIPVGIAERFEETPAENIFKIGVLLGAYTFANRLNERLVIVQETTRGNLPVNVAEHLEESAEDTSFEPEDSDEPYIDSEEVDTEPEYETLSALVLEDLQNAVDQLSEA